MRWLVGLMSVFIGVNNGEHYITAQKPVNTLYWKVLLVLSFLWHFYILALIFELWYSRHAFFLKRGTITVVDEVSYVLPRPQHKQRIGPYGCQHQVKKGNTITMNIPSLEEMLKAGVHFGHQTSKRHPHMEPYIYTARQNVSIINLEETERQLKAAAEYARELSAQGKTILFVGTKKQASALVEKYAKECGMPYVTNRWLGGLLTNFSNVIEVPRKLVTLRQQTESGELKKYTKMEQLEFAREIERLDHLVGGLVTLQQLPAAVFIVDLKEEKTALREANQLNIPIIAMCDTNTDPMKVQHPIPANDDAIKSIDLVVSVISQAISEGAQQPAAAPSSEATSEVAEAPAA